MPAAGAGVPVQSGLIFGEFSLNLRTISQPGELPTGGIPQVYSAVAVRPAACSTSAGEIENEFQFC